MEFRVLGSFGGDSPDCRMTSFLIDGSVAIDAGAITRALPIPEQRSIRHVVITHTHMDHTASLPFLIENIFGSNEGPVTFYSTRLVLAALRRHLFNNDTWPDFTRIPTQLFPSVRFVRIEAERPFTIPVPHRPDLEVTAVPVSHLVPTCGLLLRQGSSSVLLTSDTGPTERIWSIANQTSDLAACIAECSFPNRLQRVAEISLHLTPRDLASELTKLTRRVPVYVYHLKPPHVAEIRRELQDGAFTHHVEELEQGRTYRF